MPFETFLRLFEGYKTSLVRAISPRFMHGFQNNFAQMFSLSVIVSFETFVWVG